MTADEATNLIRDALIWHSRGFAGRRPSPLVTPGTIDLSSLDDPQRTLDLRGWTIPFALLLSSPSNRARLQKINLQDATIAAFDATACDVEELTFDGSTTHGSIYLTGIKHFKLPNSNEPETLPLNRKTAKTNATSPPNTQLVQASFMGASIAGDLHLGTGSQPNPQPKSNPPSHHDPSARQYVESTFSLYDSVNLRGARIQGSIYLYEVHIEHTLTLEDADIGQSIIGRPHHRDFPPTSPEDPHHGIYIGGNIFSAHASIGDAFQLRDFYLHGTLDLEDASIGSVLELTCYHPEYTLKSLEHWENNKAYNQNEQGPYRKMILGDKNTDPRNSIINGPLCLQDIQINGSFILSDTHVYGGISLKGADIAGSAILQSRHSRKPLELGVYVETGNDLTLLGRQDMFKTKQGRHPFPDDKP